MPLIVVLRGGGDLASGVALRLHRSGFQVVISELAQPLAVRRRASFAEAVYDGSTSVEGCVGRCVANPADTSLAARIMAEGQIPVPVDPNGDAVRYYHPDVIADARMLKQSIARDSYPARLLIGLGPGFRAGKNCDAVVETNRGFSMGRVKWKGSAERDTCVPEAVAGRAVERVLRAPADGIVVAHAEISDHVEPGQVIAEVAGRPVTAVFQGILRGLIHPGLGALKDMKIGDVDPGDDPRVCHQVSDKSPAGAGGVLEAIPSSLRVLESSSLKPNSGRPAAPYKKETKCQ